MLIWNYIPIGLHKKINQITEIIKKSGGCAYLVGGCIRDALLQKKVKDIDIEVFGIPTNRFIDILNSNFKIDFIGRNYGIFKIRGYPIDVSMPRKDSKTGFGHRSFVVTGDHSLNIHRSASRRDFTINSMYWNPITFELIDPYNGYFDLKLRILRNINERFSEDPLRVLRGMQLIARFELFANSNTISICRKTIPEFLSKERIFEEWRKLICWGNKPSLGMNFLKKCGWLKHFPFLSSLVNCPQDSVWHPEGDVWQHTLICLDNFAKNRLNDSMEDFIVGLAVLCHDSGKPSTTVFCFDGQIRSPRHEIIGRNISYDFLSHLTEYKELIHSVLPLISCHMMPFDLCRQNAGDNVIRRLSQKVKRIDRLIRVCRADKSGRFGDLLDFSSEDWLLKKAKKLLVQDSSPKRLISGKYLIQKGMRPSPMFKVILDKCYNAQMDGKFKNIEDGLIFLKSNM